MKPKLRFPAFKKAWQPKHGDDAFKSRRQRAIEGLPLYSVTMDQGMVRRDSLEREFASNAPDEANLRVYKDDHVYNMMRMWQGAVGRAPEDCMVSPAYVVLQPKPDTVPAFFDHWFKRKRSVYLLWAYSYGLTNDRLRLYARDFGRVPMAIPEAAEQRKIADFLGAIDERIDLLRRQQGCLAKYKSVLIQGMFDQSLRFKRDDGAVFPEWDKKPFTQLAERVTAKFDPQVSTEKPLTIELENIEAGTGIVLGETAFGDQLSLKSRFKKGNVLFGKLRPYLRKFLFADSDGICSTEIWVFQAKKVHPKFLYYLVQTDEFVSAASQSSGSKMPRADWGVVSKQEYFVPCLDEQRKIADALSALDERLAAVSAKVLHMKAFKKALLQHMFV
ncbi:type I restriction enzyme S subunit [Sphingomonas sp. BK036]|uniref:restriction endonuclease subunit S n=1 Tax=Sphingomonas sp. BK036 TaxID=2512122 RepID=UPI001029F361|nr:restriction endonuclease subunit S [Sphingomonas sp. BK036]RZT58236.1 type I restriction enzyme S subunit [Sphingomonas sp. BK036]